MRCVSSVERDGPPAARPGARAARRRARRGRAAMTRGALLAAGAAMALGVGAPAATAAATDEQWGIEPVSPLQSMGRNVFFAWGWPSGEGATFYDTNMPSEVFLGQRTPSGWQHRKILQRNPNSEPQVEDALPDFSRVIVRDKKSLGQDIDEGLYVYDGDSVTTIASYNSESYGFGEEPVLYAGGSDDKRTLYLLVRPNRVPWPESSTHLYRWVDGEATPINVDVSADRDSTCTTRSRPAGTQFASGLYLDRWDRAPLQTGISADGRTIVITPAPCRVGSGSRAVTYPSHLFVVRDGTATVMSRSLPGERSYSATFVGMSRDGERIFFTSPGRLLADDQDGVNALYLWEGGRLQRLTGGEAMPADAEVVSEAVASPDGSTVYFQVRSGTAPDQRFDLYAYRGGEVRHVVRLEGQAALDPWTTDTPAQASYDGSALLLPSRTPLFRDIDPRGRRQIHRIGIDGEVVCISCRDGVGVADAGTGIVPTRRASWPAPVISRDGSTIAFETAASLVAHDTNGMVDVYVWRDGEVTLVSSGVTRADAKASGLSWDGRTVFFQSWGALLPGTSDEFNKLYAARLDGAAPLPQPPTPCGADCQGPLTPAPFLPVPGSETFVGSGNVTPAPTLSVRRVGPAAQRRLARRGTVTVVARSNVAATIRAGMQVRLGRRWVRVARKAQRLARAGTARLQLALTPRAKRRLARTGALRVRLTVASSAVAGQRRASFVVRAPKRRARASVAASRSGNETTTAASQRVGTGSGRDA